MKIQKFNEKFNEKDINIKNAEIQKLKTILEKCWDDAIDTVSYDEDEGYNSLSFSSYWDLHGDDIILNFGILEKTEQHNNIREILPQMVRISNNSQITVT